MTEHDTPPAEAAAAQCHIAAAESAFLYWQKQELGWLAALVVTSAVTVFSVVGTWARSVKSPPVALAESVGAPAVFGWAAMCMLVGSVVLSLVGFLVALDRVSRAESVLEVAQLDDTTELVEVLDGAQ